MAHAVVEWTDNLEGDFDLHAFMSLIAEEMRERSEGIFPTGGIRVRGVRLADYIIADGQGPEDGFINVEVLMGVGRSADFKRVFFDRLFDRMTEFLDALIESRPLAVSLYVFESEGWKKNSIHKRLQRA